MIMTTLLYCIVSILLIIGASLTIFFSIAFNPKKMVHKNTVYTYSSKSPFHHGFKFNRTFFNIIIVVLLVIGGIVATVFQAILNFVPNGIINWFSTSEWGIYKSFGDYMLSTVFVVDSVFPGDILLWVIYGILLLITICISIYEFADAEVGVSFIILILGVLASYILGQVFLWLIIGLVYAFCYSWVYIIFYLPAVFYAIGVLFFYNKSKYHHHHIRHIISRIIRRIRYRFKY